MRTDTGDVVPSDAATNVRTRFWFWMDNRLRWSLLILVFLITLLHYLLPPENFVLHNVLQRLYYIPIVWTAYALSRRRAVMIALISGAGYIPHIFMTWEAHPAYQSAQMVEVLLFPVVGLVSGWIFDREAELRQTALGYARMAQFGSVARTVIRPLKSPVKSIQGMLISLDAAIGDQPGAREFIRVIRSQIETIADVRNRLISLVERKRVRLAIMDLNELAREFAQQTALLLASHDISLRMRLTRKSLKCRVARKQFLGCLHQLVDEMTSNDGTAGTVTLYSGESDRIRWLGCSSEDIRLESYYLSDLASLENGSFWNHPLVDVLNVMNSHFGTAKVRRRNGQLVEFILVLPKRLRLPWYLKEEMKKRERDHGSPAQEDTETDRSSASSYRL